MLRGHLKSGDLQAAIATLEVVLDPAAPVATAWTIRADHRYPTRITGRLREAANGNPVADVPVRLQVRWHGTRRWRTLTSATTNSDGRVAYRHRITRAGSFRYLTAASDAHTRAVSGAVFVKVPVRVRVRVRASLDGRRLTGHLRTAAGRPLAGQPLLVQRRGYGVARWWDWRTGTTDRAGQISYRTSPGRHRLRYPGSPTHEAGSSQTLRVPRSS